MAIQVKILVVHPGSGWVLSHIASKLAQADPGHFICQSFGEVFREIPGQGYNVVIPEGVDGIFYLDVQCCWMSFIRDFPSVNKLLHVGFYTHLHENNPVNYRPHYSVLDGIIQMCEMYRAVFLEQGWLPANRMTVLRPGEVAGQFPLKKTKIGICQRGEHVGKGRDFLPEVVRSLRPEIRDGLELHFKGKGWDDAFEGRAFRVAYFHGGTEPERWFSGNYHGVSAFSYASEDGKSYPPFYDKIDYYLVPSNFEGGPMGLLEALAVGLPVISSEVGWVPEFKRVAHLYPAADVDALAIILTEIVERKLLRRAEVESMNYKTYASGVLAFFEKLRGLE